MLYLFLLGIFFIIVADTSTKRTATNSNEVKVINKTIDKYGSDSISSSETHIWVKNLDKSMQDDLHRIRASLPGHSGFPKDAFSFVQFSVSNGRDSVVFRLPEKTGNGSIIYETSRFLYPLFNTYDRDDKGPQSLVITVHTWRNISFKYDINVKGLAEGQYVIKLKNGSWSLSNQKVGVGKPEANYWNTLTVNSAKMSIISEDPSCAVLYLTNKEESIYYSTGEIDSNPRSGFRAISFSQRLDLNLQRRDLGEQLFLAVLLQPDDSLCDPNAPPRKSFNEQKNYNITITTEEEKSYWLPMSFFVGVFLATPVILTIYVVRKTPKRDPQFFGHDPHPLITFDSSTETSQPANQHFALETLQETPLEHELQRSSSTEGYFHRISSTENTDSWSVGDLHFAFYMIPGLLLSGFQYAEMLSFNRMEDTCYHNYGCSRPLGDLIAFNHLISNIGYVLNGFYYILFVAIRHQNHYKGRGPFKNYGLELSLGAALICQGIGSTIYHVCPSRLSFNFDTPFMEVICVLAMLKLYGNRHGNVPPARANVLIAGVIAANVVVSIWDKTILSRMIQGIVQMVIASLLTLKVKRGRIGPDTRISSIKNSAFGITVLLLNLVVAIGHLFNTGWCQSNQVVMLLCVGNMTLYLIYYFFSKVQTREKLNWLSSVAAITSLFLWTAAGFFFFQEETNWKLTAAQSRNLNSDCFLMSFFDRHDIWHLLSAEAVLASLVALSTLDDAQASFPREELAIF